MILTAEQQAAVTRTGQDVCVVAGPGSGKTRVLVERFHWLVSQGVSPLRILAITFTEKAANEIRSRLVHRFAADPQQRQQIERAYVSTVHGFCSRLLRENALPAGLDPAFGLIESHQADRELARAFEDVLDEIYREDRPALAALIEGWRTPDPVASLREVYGVLRVSGEDLEALLSVDTPAPGQAFIALAETVAHALLAVPPPKTDAQKLRVDALQTWSQRLQQLGSQPASPDHFAALAALTVDKRGLPEGHPLKFLIADLRESLLDRARSRLVAEYYRGPRQLLRTTLLRADERYRERKAGLGVLDFDDLQEEAIRLLRDQSSVRQRVQHSFDAILMDELQDTNPLQWQLMNLLRRPHRFFGVGDVNQSIYGFRHADPGGFLRYRQEVEQSGGTVDYLQRNYRSRAEILAAVGTVAQYARGIEPHQLAAEGGNFAPQAGPFVEIVAAAGEDTDTGEEIEAAWIAHELRQWEGRLRLRAEQRVARFSDMAVLVRTRSSLARLEYALRRFDVPYVLEGGQTYFEQQEVCDLTHYLRILANGQDEIAWLGVLRSPLVGVSDETLLRLREYGDRFGDVILALPEQPALADASEWARLHHFRERWLEQRQFLDDTPSDLLLAAWLDEVDYLGGLTPQGRANVDKFCELLRGFASRGIVSIAAQVAELRVLRRAANEPNAPVLDSRDAVTLLTMHKAKGLEFPLVILASLHKGGKINPNPLIFHASTGIGAVWRDPATGDSIPDPAHEAYAHLAAERERLESDRLLYVAMTRAEERLVLSYVERKVQAHWPTSLAVLPSSLAPVRRIDYVLENTFAAGMAQQRTETQLVPPWPRREARPARATLGEIAAFAVGQGAYVEAPRPLRAEFRRTEFARRILGGAWQTPFLIEWSGLLITGELDLFYEEDDRLVLVHVGAQENEHAHWEARIAASVLNRLEGREVASVLLFTGQESLHPVDLSLQAVELLIRRFQATALAV